MYLYDDHPFAGVAATDDDVAQQACLLAQVEEGQAVINGIAVDGVAYVVVQVGHEPALPDGQDFVEGPCDVETYGRGKGYAALHVFVGQPLLVAATEVKFVAVLPYVCRPLDGAEPAIGVVTITEWRQFYLADARQLVIDLLLLERQLLGVGECLPFASSTDAEVLALGRDALRRGGDEPHYLALGVGVLLAAQLNVNDVARDAERHKDDKRSLRALALGELGLLIAHGAIGLWDGCDMKKTVAFCGNGLYDDVS